MSEINRAMRPRERLGCRDLSAMHDHVQLVGIITVEEEDRATGEITEVAEVYNTIQPAGEALFLDLIAGLSGDHMDGDTVFRIEDGGGSLIKSLGTADMQPGYPSTDEDGNNDPRVTWQWKDGTDDNYTIGSVEVRSPAGVIFSVVNTPYATNEKPADKNWIYTYRLTIVAGSGEPFDDGVSGAYAGFDLLADLIIGDSAEHFSGTTELEVLDGGVSLGTRGADGAPSRSGSTLTWVFTVPTGELNGDWDTVIIQTGVDSELRRSSSDGLTPKSNSIQREITYQFSV